jgi:hypothetical protein
LQKIGLLFFSPFSSAFFFRFLRPQSLLWSSPLKLEQSGYPLLMRFVQFAFKGAVLLLKACQISLDLRWA